MKTKIPVCKFCTKSGHSRWQCYEYKMAQIKAPKPPKIPKVGILSTNKIKRPRTPQKSSHSLLLTEADRLFSRYIRITYSIGGFATCVSCGRKDAWQNMDNGHYISRRYGALRFDPLNCHVQCVDCNRYKNGNLPNYKAYLLKRYGSWVFEYYQGKLNESTKLSAFFLQGIIDQYKEYA